MRPTDNACQARVKWMTAAGSCLADMMVNLAINSSVVSLTSVNPITNFLTQAFRKHSLFSKLPAFCKTTRMLICSASLSMTEIQPDALVRVYLGQGFIIKLVVSFKSCSLCVMRWPYTHR